MTNTNLFKKKMKDKGLKQMYIAEKIGITSYSLSLKINNKNDFKSKEIQKICELLSINTLEEKDKIFFGKQVD